MLKQNTQRIKKGFIIHSHTSVTFPYRGVQHILRGGGEEVYKHDLSFAFIKSGLHLETTTNIQCQNFFINDINIQMG